MLFLRANSPGPPHDFLIFLFHTGSATGGLANANFANFDNFPKSCSADFGSFSSSSQSNSTGAGRDVVQSSSVPADKYAALADLDNVLSSAITEQGKLLLPSLFHRSEFLGKEANQRKLYGLKHCDIRLVELSPLSPLSRLL